MPARCDVAVMGGDRVGSTVLARAGLGVVCFGVVRLDIWHRRWLGPWLDSQLSW